mgnify:FL=1
MHTCPMVILLLVAVGMTSSCSRQPEAMPNDSTEILGAEREQRMADVSGRWKKEKRIDDFHFLKDNWIKPGCTVDFAKEVLGEPLNTHQAEDGSQFWMYVKCDAEKKQFHSWTLLLDSGGKVTGWRSKGIM